jgi:hypothetical protein
VKAANSSPAARAPARGPARSFSAETGATGTKQAGKIEPKVSAKSKTVRKQLPVTEAEVNLLVRFAGDLLAELMEDTSPKRTGKRGVEK